MGVLRHLSGIICNLNMQKYKTRPKKLQETAWKSPENLAEIPAFSHL